MTFEISFLMSMSGLALIPGYFRFLKGREPLPARAVGVLSGVTLLVFAFDMTVISNDIFLAVAHLTVTFQAIKSFDLKEPWDHLQVYFMSLLQLVIASELTRSLTFGIVFIVFMVMLVTAMVLSHFLKQGTLGKVNTKKPVFIISILTVLATALIFVALPRTPHKVIGKTYKRGMKTVGFTERVQFGSFGEVKIDPSVVMRIEMSGKDWSPFYLRGLTFDYFDGLSWRNTAVKKYRVYKRIDEFMLSRYDKGDAIEQKIFLEPIDSAVLFGMNEISGIRADVRYLLKDSAGGVFLPRQRARRIGYTVFSIVRDGYEGIPEIRYLQLPDDMEKVADLARTVSANGETAYDKAGSIEQYLRNNYTYSLITTPPPVGLTPLEDFLFHAKTGYCEHYATSMVLMLRGLGIHARIVNGFYAGEKNEYGDYIIVRQRDAHSWVEALIDGKWRRFDPTPVVPTDRPLTLIYFLDLLKLNWFQYVVGYSSFEQRELIRMVSAPFRLYRSPYLDYRSITDFLGAITVFVLVVLLPFVLYRVLRRRKYGFFTEYYLRFRDTMRKKGITASPSMTASDYKKASSRFSAHKEVAEFLLLYEDHRFGNKSVGPAVRERYMRLFREIKKGRIF
jgi:hypothetical protein